MEYYIIKSPIPIIFIDTFAIIEFYKQNTFEVKNANIIALFELLKELVYKKKIICPIAYQEQEIYEHVFDTMKNFSKLSYGLQFIDSYEIQLSQFEKMLYCVRNKNFVFSLNYNEAFDDDIISKIKSQDGLIITVSFEPSKNEIEQRKDTKVINLLELNEFKESPNNLKDINKQIEAEYLGPFQASSYSLENYLKKTLTKKQITDKELNQYVQLFLRPYELYKKVLGEDKSISEFFDFLKSDIHKEIPYIDINTKMIADIVVSNRKFDSGDSVDITNASALLPYCNYFLTDKRQKNRLKRFDFDLKYKAEIFSFTESDIISLIDTLKKLL